ncbi:S-layer homology domain-containing protein [Paenibacillus sp. MMO-177]|uniref:S-layer homology domain-containing protein n=1 Tax=Paenibacillus sp. MMO-177 TaxID=3081289 RepID=UPI003018D802
MKKMLLTLVSVGLACSLLVPTSAVSTHKVEAATTKPSFKDISGHWAESSIETAVQAGILNGYSDGTYKPNNTITRAELLKVMALTFKLEIGSGGSTWYAPYQTALAKAGVYMDGDYPGNVNNPATRNEMAKLAVRGEYAEYRNKKLTAAELMFRAVNKGILSRSGTKAESINTEGTTTRAEAAVLVTRLLKLSSGGTLTVDKGASSAAEIAWRGNNMITMLNQKDIKTLPFSVDINKKYNVTIDKLIILDPADTNGYYMNYLDGATYYPSDKKLKPADNYVFAFKVIGKNLVTDGAKQYVTNSFYMYMDDYTGSTIKLAEKYFYRDGSLSDRNGLFVNDKEFVFRNPNEKAYNYIFALVPKKYIDAQIKEYGGFPIHLERFNVSFGKDSQFYLTNVKDVWGS